MFDGRRYMLKRIKQWRIQFALVCCLLNCGVVSAEIYQFEEGPLSEDITYPRQIQTIASVYDGDTVRFENGQRVRLLGVSAPEIKSQYRPGDAGGIKAKSWLKTKVAGKKVLVEYDRQRRDKYQRALVHLFLPDGEHVNVSMVKQGLASALIIPPNLQYTEEMIRAEQYAEQNRLGIWALSDYQPQSLTRLLKQRKNKGWQRYLLTASRYKRSQKYSRLIVSDKVDIRIPNAFLTAFPTLDNYLDKPLEVRGWVSRAKGHYSILIRHPSAIIID